MINSKIIISAFLIIVGCDRRNVEFPLQQGQEGSVKVIDPSEWRTSYASFCEYFRLNCQSNLPVATAENPIIWEAPFRGLDGGSVLELDPFTIEADGSSIPVSVQVEPSSEDIDNWKDLKKGERIRISAAWDGSIVTTKTVVEPYVLKLTSIVVQINDARMVSRESDR